MRGEGGQAGVNTETREAGCTVRLNGAGWSGGE